MISTKHAMVFALMGILFAFSGNAEAAGGGMGEATTLDWAVMWAALSATLSGLVYVIYLMITEKPISSSTDES